MRLASLTWVLVAFALGLSGAESASAGAITGCGNGCLAQILVNGAVAAEGNFLVDPNTGDIRLETQIGVYTADYSAWIYSVSGNQDPVLGFGLGATNNSAAPVTFGFAFSLPISIPEPIQASSSVSYSVSDLSVGLVGATLFPTSGTGFVVDSQDIRITPFLSVDKRVDVGPACSIGPGVLTANCGPYVAGPVIWGAPGGPTYDLMSVIVGFGLTPRSSAGLSGQVRQDPIPEPGTLGLLGVGLAGLVFARRKLGA